MNSSYNSINEGGKEGEIAGTEENMPSTNSGVLRTRGPRAGLEDPRRVWARMSGLAKTKNEAVREFARRHVLRSGSYLTRSDE